jgi:hypothetical protein
MPKIIIFCLGLLGAWSSICAQDEPIVVLAAQGKISYQSPGYSSKTLSSAAVLKNTGTVKMKAGSSLAFFSTGELKTLQGPQTKALKDLYPGGDGLAKINFERSFDQYLIAGLDLAANPQNPKDAWGTVSGKKGTGDGWGTVSGKKGTGDGWGTVSGKKGTGDGWGTVSGKKGTGDGWGGKGKVINGIAPFGKMRPGTRLFQWSKPAGAQNFQLEIKNNKGEIIHKAEAADTALTLELDPAKFKEGQMYTWTVKTAAGDVQSSPLVFEIAPQQAQSAAVQKAETAEAYAKAPASVQGLMRAVALEQGEWYLDAAQTYRDLQKAEPNNLLLKLMHAAFWMRNGPKPVAELAFKEP